MNIKKSILMTYLKISTIGSFGLLMVACSKPPSILPNVKVTQKCENPIASYKLGDIKSGDFNQLNIGNIAIKEFVEDALNKSNCFIKTDVLGYNDNYLLEIVYGSINVKSKRGDFLQSTSQNAAIIEIQMAFSNKNEFRVFNGKATIENNAEQYFALGEEAKLLPNEVKQTITNATNAAVNEAIQSFKTN